MSGRKLTGKLERTLYCRYNHLTSFETVHTKELGLLQYCLGTAFHRYIITKSVTMSQRKYFPDIQKNFKTHDCRTVYTEIDSRIKLPKGMEPKSEGKMEEMKTILFRQAVGTGIHLAFSTWSAFVYTISVLSQFNTKPSKAYWTAMKRLFRYLQNWYTS